METIKLFLTKFTDETITISSMSLLFVTCVLIIYWIYNRKKFHKLTHQIPASVVKNYLDSTLVELEMMARKPLIEGRKPHFIYFGGGTPSYLSAKQLAHRAILRA